VTPVIYLRIASVLTLIHSLLHTVAGVFSAPPPGTQQAAAAAMKASQFDVMGLTRTYWDFHLGFGLAIGLFLLVEGVVFWQLSLWPTTLAAQQRPILVTFAIGYLALAGISWKYFFPPPFYVEILIALCLGATIVSKTRLKNESGLKN
jgi:hypothetical protein